MTVKNNNVKSYGREGDIQALTDAAKTLILCSKDIQKATERINQSSNTPGTKGATHKSQLQAKVEEMKKLAALYKTAAKKLISAASKITNGMSMDEVLSEVIGFKNF